MINAVAVWLTGRVPTLTVGTNLFVGWRPTTAPVRCQTIAEPSGGESHYGQPNRIDPIFQIVTRGEDYQQARLDAWAVFNAIDGTAGWNIPAYVSGGQAYKAMTISALALPQYIGQDEGGGFEFSTNYIFRSRKL